MRKLTAIAATALALFISPMSGMAKDGKVVIGLAMPSQIVERFVRDKDFFVEAARARGDEVLVQIADEDQAKQNAQVENLIAQGIDVLVINPHDSAAAATAVASAKAAGIPVVSYVRLVTDAAVDAWVADDFFATGEIQGQYLADRVPKGNYILLHGAPEDFVSTLFYDGAMSKLQPLIDRGDIKVIVDQAAKAWQPTNALAIVENGLTISDNKIDAVLSPNDGLAGGAIEALAAQNLAGKVVVTGGDAGLDAAKRIVAGTQSMTVYRDIKALAETAVIVAERLARKEPLADLVQRNVNNGQVDVPSIFGKAVAVDKTNLDSILIDSGFQKRQDVYGK